MPLADSRLGSYQCLIGTVDGRSLIVWTLGGRVDRLLNGERISKARLQPGDHLTMGDLVFEVQYDLAAKDPLVLV